MKEKIEAIRHDVFLVLTDPECDLSNGAKKALRYVMNELEALANHTEQPLEMVKLPVKTYSGGKAWHVAPTQPLSDYINAASIGGNDCPHVVVEKLQKAIDAEAMKGQK